MDEGVEIRLFDARRTPSDWTELLRPTQCAVFLKIGAPLETCFVFDRLDAAQQFCERKLAASPALRCEIYDAQGPANPALIVLERTDHQAKGFNRGGPGWFC